MRVVQAVADRVVLPHEERVQQREPDPEVACDAGEVDVRLHLLRDQAELIDPELAVLARSQCVREARVAPVDLGAVPPVRVVGDERRRPFGARARVGAGARDPHRVLGPRVVVGQRHDPPVLLVVLAVAEPVVYLELDPRAREQVERRRRDELLAREQLAADRPRIRLERIPFAHGVLERHVAAEAAAEAAHQRVVEVVERPVQRAGRHVSGVIVDVWPVERPAAGVVEVLPAQHVAQADEDEHRKRQRQLVPADASVDRLCGGVVQAWHSGSPLADWRRTDVTTGLRASQSLRAAGAGRARWDDRMRSTSF